MRSKWALGIVAMLMLSFLPLAFAAVTTSTTKSVSTTTPDLCGPQLCQTNTPKNNTFDPSKVAGYFGADIGSFNVKTAPDGFQWATAPQDSLTMGIPTVGGSPTLNSAVYYNSTHTAYKLSGAFGSLNVFFKQTQYQVKIAIHSSFSSPQTVCLPFSSPNPIVQQSSTNQTSRITTFSPSIRAGNQIFDWGDVSMIFTPTWSGINSSLCLDLPVGTTNIDPVALDGSGHNKCGSGCSSVAVSLTTTTTNDVIVCEVNVFGTTISSFSDTSSLSWTARVNNVVQGGAGKTHFYEEYAISSGTLSADSITVNIAASQWITMICFGVSGGNTGTPFDPNVSLPAIGQNTGGSPTVTYSTSNANDFLIGNFANDKTVQGTCASHLDSGFAQIAFDGGVDECTEYKIVSSTQSSQTITLYAGSIGNWIELADAIQQASGTGVTLVQEKTCTFTTSTSPTCQFNSSVTSGNIVYVIAYDNNRLVTVSSMTDSGSNAYYFVISENSITSTLGELEGWYSVTSTGGTLTVTVNFGLSTTGAIVINEISGARSDTPLSSNGFNTGTSTSVTSYTIDANSLAIGGLISNCRSGCTITAGSGYTLDDDVAYGTFSQASSEHMLNTGTSETTPFTISISAAWFEISAAFAPSASAVSYTYTFSGSKTGSVNFYQNPGGSRFTFMTDVPTLRQLVGKAAAATISLASTFVARITVSNIANAIIMLTPSFLANCQSTSCIQHIVSGQVFGSFMLAAIVVGFMLIAIMVAKRR